MLGTAKTHINKGRNKHPFINEAFSLFMIVAGAVSVAAGLELFLVPNEFLDGGVVGISIIVSSFFPSIPLGVFIGILNIPFLYVAYKHAGVRAVIRTAVGVGVLSVSTVLLHHFHAVTDEFFIALICGGTLVGFGVGLALRFGGALDGTEMLAVFISEKSRFEVADIILAINFCIFTVAAFVFGVESALASFMLFYLVVAPLITKVHEGNDETKEVKIITTQPDLVEDGLHSQFNINVVASKIQHNGVEKAKLTGMIVRSQEKTLAEMVAEIDPAAKISTQDVSILLGGAFSQNKHH